MEKSIPSNGKSAIDGPDGNSTMPALSPESSVLDASQLGQLVKKLNRLHLFKGVLDDDIGREYLRLLEGLAAPEDRWNDEAVHESYTRLFSLLAAEVELSPDPLVGDGWQNHLLDRLLCDENPFSLKAQKAAVEEMGSSLMRAAMSDLAVLQMLFRWDAQRLRRLLESRQGGEPDGLISWEELRPLSLDSSHSNGSPSALKSRLAMECDWPGLLADLARHFASSGSGVFARYRAFRWVRRGGHGALEGVANPDAVRLDDLVEYQLERSLLLENTEQFVAGFRANNVLLYGDRGTGKSSTIKALLGEYGDRGLRLIEVPKGLLSDFTIILGKLRGRRERFILFVDDLSFDEQETTYKELKAALEGSLESRPENVVVYATSNRRHLVQERFSDRMSGDGEIRSFDTHQEKLSLADRFGITLVFSTPDQPRYLRIVQSLAEQLSLDIDPAELRSSSLRWASQQGGFSGRTARQFVDHLAGRLAVRRG